MVIQSQDMKWVLNSDLVVGYFIDKHTDYSSCEKTQSPKVVYRILATIPADDEFNILGVYKEKARAQVELDAFAVNLAANLRYYHFMEDADE